MSDSISDTHVPSRATGLPDWVADEIRRADHAIHAGDFDSTQAYDRIVDLADGNLTCVRGNVDPAGLELPAVETVILEDVTVAVTHGTGSPVGWHRRVLETARVEAAEADAVVAGHTHEVVDAVREGIRVLNPGSATAASPASRETMLVATVEDGTLEVERRTG